MKTLSLKKAILTFLLFVILILFSGVVFLKSYVRDSENYREKAAYNRLKFNVNINLARRPNLFLGSIESFHPSLITGRSAVDLIRECPLQDYKLVHSVHGFKKDWPSYYWFLCEKEEYNIYFNSIGFGPQMETIDKFGVCNKANCPKIDEIFVPFA